MDITRNMNGARALVVGAGLALALAMGAVPTPAMAAGRVGTTKVMVRTEIDNVEFKVPTVIPFVAKAGRRRQHPSVWASHGLCPARTGAGRHASDGRPLGARPRRPRGTVGADRRQTMALGSRRHSSRRGNRRPRSAHQTQPETKHGQAALN